jgi:hypothetical protein
LEIADTSSQLSVLLNGDKAAVALVQGFFFAGFNVVLASLYAVNDRLAGNGQEGLLLVSV